MKLFFERSFLEKGFCVDAEAILLGVVPCHSIGRVLINGHKERYGTERVGKTNGNGFGQNKRDGKMNGNGLGKKIRLLQRGTNGWK